VGKILGIEDHPPERDTRRSGIITVLSQSEIAGAKRIYQHLPGLSAPAYPQNLVSDYRAQRGPTRNLATALREQKTGTLISPASWKAECPPRFHYEPKLNVQRLEVADCSRRWNTPRSCHP
jgi:hypothetical protein